MSAKVFMSTKDQARLRKDIAEFIRKEGKLVDDALTATAIQIRHDAIQLAPVDKGRLWTSLRWSTPQNNKNHKSRIVSTNVVYGAYIETGTPIGTGPNGGPRPFLKPALEMNKTTLTRALRRLMK